MGRTGNKQHTRMGPFLLEIRVENSCTNKHLHCDQGHRQPNPELPSAHSSSNTNMTTAESYEMNVGASETKKVLNYLTPFHAKLTSLCSP